MGSRGPVPKRSDQRVRRNKDEAGPVDKIEVGGDINAPDLDIPNCHPIIQDFYDSLKESAQTQYYEASDWQYARFICFYMNDQLSSGKLSGQMLASINSALSELLVSEGSRRRVRLEIDREQSEGAVLDLAQMFRDRQAN